jgi:hypothetical protein
MKKSRLKALQDLKQRSKIGGDGVLGVPAHCVYPPNRWYLPRSRKSSQETGPEVTLQSKSHRLLQEDMRCEDERNPPRSGDSLISKRACWHQQVHFPHTMTRYMRVV